MPGTPPRRIPEATVSRLPIYLRSLLELAGTDTTTVSSEGLAHRCGVNAAKVRKDLSHLGSYGTRGVGYDVEVLLAQISRELGLTQDWPVAIVGLGNLGRALANYKGFGARGFRIVGLFDADPRHVGDLVGGIAIRSMDDLDEVAAQTPISIGIIAVPAPVAQQVADRLVGAGVTSILNFAPVVITVPDRVSLRKVDLSIELQILSFYSLRGADLPGADRSGADRPGLRDGDRPGADRPGLRDGDRSGAALAGLRDADPPDVEVPA